MLTKDVGICIRAIDYSETSQIVTFFAQVGGKITAIAKGSKRPKSAFEGPIELLSFGDIVLAGADREGMATLTEFRQRPAFARPATDLFTLNCCLFAAELVNKLTRDWDPHPQLFEDLLALLQRMTAEQDAGRQNGALVFLILFELALLGQVGLAPVLGACVNCKTALSTRWRESYFSDSANGLICGDCEASFPEKTRLSPSAAAALSNLQALSDATGEVLREIERVLVAHFTYILGRTPRMAKHVVGV